MSAAHDPIRDPLPPYWREKVERAFDPSWNRPAHRPSRPLTALERDTMAALAIGLSGAEIARNRGVTRTCVYTQRDAALRKLGRAWRD